MGIVVNLQRYSLGDGPGIRTTVFLKGCPLKCLWCANPESQDPRPEIGHRESLCRHCGKCVEACPTGAASVREGQVRIDRDVCVRCGACVRACLYKSMTWYGEEMTADEVVREVRKDEMFYGADGGVTLSGGEVLMQAEFAAEILQKCREAGIGTAIETSGFGGKLDLLLPWLDLVMFDVKTGTSELHKKLTGVPNEPIRENLKKAAASGVAVLARYPMIPGYNDDEAEIAGIADIVRECGVANAEIMPYHSFGVTKYDAIGRDYTVESSAPDEDKLRRAVEIFTQHGVHCTVGGHSAAPAVEPDTREPRCADAMLLRDKGGC